nr:unnamed protein product [Callosobruchus chinensis]
MLGRFSPLIYLIPLISKQTSLCFAPRCNLLTITGLLFKVRDLRVFFKIASLMIVLRHHIKENIDYYCVIDETNGRRPNSGGFRPPVGSRELVNGRGQSPILLCSPVDNGKTMVLP